MGPFTLFSLGQGDFLFYFIFDTYCVSFPPPGLYLPSNWQNIPCGFHPSSSVRIQSNTLELLFDVNWRGHVLSVFGFSPTQRIEHGPT